TGTSPISVATGTSTPVISLGTVPVASGGTGATTLTGYIMGTGTTAMTASATIPAANISGNISGNAANVTGTVAVANGGTGATSATVQGGVIYGSSTTVMASTVAGTSGQVLTSNGTSAPTWSSTLSGNAATATSATNLTGGSAGTIAYQTAAGATSQLTAGTSGYLLKSNGAAAPSWLSTLPVANGGTGTTNGSITGTTALTFAAGGTYQNATLTPSGTGYTLLNGKVNIGDNQVQPQPPPYTLSVASYNSGQYTARISNFANSSSAHGLLIRAGGNTIPFGATMIGFQNIDGAVIGSITQNEAFTVSYNTSSDRRLKNNIVNTHFGINDLMKIQVRDYVYKADAGNTLTTGFIAQELFEIFPNAVTKPANDDDMWSVDYGKVTPLLVKAIQDLKKTNDTQKLTNDAQQKQINAQQTQIDVLTKLVESMVKK
ncbi:MAG: tail fiber domain-containing protein, partial [Paludibacter sp.]